jgi:hypothetical protein
MRRLVHQITNINQLVSPYRGRKAVVQLANQIMGRLIIASQYLAFRKPDGDWHPETQLSARQGGAGMKAVKAPTPRGSRAGERTSGDRAG